ncbi:tRNA uridine-5-carboxymethylaminomethyl(34) synthesis GTPase MnmE [Acuticoccus sp. MNP-M23]|uniref:tRNA uridine-5-carboxymethylaminomethyl(34) synthesis GTPase MnmE n=1 Tax=Acuticoccus sp. MNP-M23 TaxID=3072793 RepID=UPI002814FB16|nr:tRNA uridine-5-carboxymethylaminomethyl(34) synthesis GTPase MnmE [Acuticoccus sp. MNP-M23]WMS44283.1 tRNA uridine-5-carboxymethylaminomethyl(34) synthesis GTPase MnmE [Acuticoccus sp. MNP-M23]
MTRFTGTIVALSSGPPPSGIAILRISGPDAMAVAQRFGTPALPPRRATLRTLTAPSDGAVIDQALCLAFPGPASATGEDMVEYHCHGSPAVVDRMLTEAVALPGVRVAEPGEFTMRAVLSGRMGLADAEALAELIDARTEAERRRAVRLAGGALTSAISGWRAALIAALALCEAHIDFADESDIPDGGPPVEQAIAPVAAEIAAALAGSRDADKLADGFRIVLAGPPNAGKSSLINALAGRAIALVSDEPGTTRDVVATTLDLGGYRVVIADTAGVREGAAGVEAMGIARTRAEIEAADFIVEVTSPDTIPLRLPSADLRIAHKSDLRPADADLATSLADPASIEALAARLTEAAARGMAGSEAALITRARQRSACEEIAAALAEATDSPHLEMKAEALRSACHAVGRLTGDIGVEDILDDVFGRFCIGK